MNTQSTVPVRNSLLAGLTEEQYLKILPMLEPVTLHFGEVLHEIGAKIDDVYFPVTSMISLLTLVDHDRASEVGIIGNEGLLGLSVALGVRTSPVRGVVQGTGTAMRLDAESFVLVLNAHPRLRQAIDQFVHALMSQTAQTTACNTFHTLEQRLARWLLMTQDRLARSHFTLTHKFLAAMLGVRRVGVSMAAKTLQKKKMIEYSRGNITIVDRRALLATACNCYEVVNKIYSAK